MLLLLIACNKESFEEVNNDHTLCLPPPNSFFLTLENEAGDNLLETVYLQDSFIIYNSDTLILTKTSNNYWWIGFEFYESGTDYYLDLSETDTDTIALYWHSECEEGCGPCYFIDSLFYNSVLQNTNDQEYIELPK